MTTNTKNQPEPSCPVVRGSVMILFQVGSNSYKKLLPFDLTGLSQPATELLDSVAGLVQSGDISPLSFLNFLELLKNRDNSYAQRELQKWWNNEKEKGSLSVLNETFKNARSMGLMH